MVPGSKRRPSIVFRCLLFSFQQKLQSVEVGIQLLLELLADQTLRQLEEAADLGLDICGQLGLVLADRFKPEGPLEWHWSHGDFESHGVGRAQIVISRVDSILRPKNLLTESWVEPTPGGPSDVQWEDSVRPCQLASLAGSVT